MKKLFRIKKGNGFTYCLNDPRGNHASRYNLNVEYFHDDYMDASDIMKYRDFQIYKNMRCFLWLKLKQ